MKTKGNELAGCLRQDFSSPRRLVTLFGGSMEWACDLYSLLSERVTACGGEALRFQNKLITDISTYVRAFRRFLWMQMGFKEGERRRLVMVVEGVMA